MFDIAFTELLLIAVIALIVIGPERLPKVARTAGHVIGRMQRYVSDIKADISREMELDELKKLQSGMEDAARTFSSTLDQEVREAEGEFDRLARGSDPAPDPYPDDDFPAPPEGGRTSAGQSKPGDAARPADEDALREDRSRGRDG